MNVLNTYRVMDMVFNATFKKYFSYIVAVISSNHRLAASNFMTLSLSSTHRHEWDSHSQF